MQLNNLDCSAAACCSWKEQDFEGFETREKINNRNVSFHVQNPTLLQDKNTDIRQVCKTRTMATFLKILS